MSVQHITDEDSHGPVDVFVSDTGHIAFVCRKDSTYWEGVLTVMPPAEDAPERKVASFHKEKRSKIAGDNLPTELTSDESAAIVRRRVY